MSAFRRGADIARFLSCQRFTRANEASLQANVEGLQLQFVLPGARQASAGMPVLEWMT